MVFVTLELQAGFLVTAGTVALLGAYYDASFADFMDLLAVAMVLTAGALGWGLYRIHPRLRPIAEWVAGAHDEEHTERAWAAAVGLPLTLVREELLYPIIAVVVPSCVAGVVILDLSWLDFFPLVVAGRVAVGYGAILHHLTIEAGYAADPDRHQPRGLAAGRDRDLGVAAALAAVDGAADDQRDHRRRRRRDRRRRQPRRLRPRRDRGGDDDLAGADDPALAVGARAARRPEAGDRRGCRGRLRRRRSDHDRRRDRRAGGLVQPDGRRPPRARADPSGLRHLPRPRRRRAHPQRRLLRGRRARRGLDPLL